jgi:tRNA 2-thiocytidine biosynthesis protein TtcA
MLTAWERQYPGRTESIFSALRNVETGHLADPAIFDFKGLEGTDAESPEAPR